MPPLCAKHNNKNDGAGPDVGNLSALSSFYKEKKNHSGYRTNGPGSATENAFAIFATTREFVGGWCIQKIGDSIVRAPDEE